MARERGVWTEADDRLLRELHARKVSFGDMARYFDGKTRNALIGRARRLGLPTRKWGPRTAAKRARRSKPSQPPAPKPPVFRLAHEAASFADLSVPERAPEQAADQAADEGGCVPLHETAAAAVAALRPRQCRWPFGDPARGVFGFCVNSRPGSGPYCADHALAARSRARGGAAEASGPADNGGTDDGRTDDGRMGDGRLDG